MSHSSPSQPDTNGADFCPGLNLTWDNRLVFCLATIDDGRIVLHFEDDHHTAVVTPEEFVAMQPKPFDPAQIETDFQLDVISMFHMGAHRDAKGLNLPTRRYARSDLVKRASLYRDFAALMALCEPEPPPADLPANCSMTSEIETGLVIIEARDGRQVKFRCRDFKYGVRMSARGETAPSIGYIYFGDYPAHLPKIDDPVQWDVRDIHGNAKVNSIAVYHPASGIAARFTENVCVRRMAWPFFRSQRFCFHSTSPPVRTVGNSDGLVTSWGFDVQADMN